ncbi:BlaI/MecI/CopY family transcriptional regulator [Flexivirga caeni]|nr:BlaI/MecI/CopY family transcriptional regulator [Flexivirga caeni]
MSKRERGQLRADVLRLLWDGDGPVTANVLLDRFPTGERPALTTLLTVLSRLESEGLVAREQQGRASVFSVTRPQAEHFAQQMSQVLGASGDRSAVLQQFAGALSEHDLAVLRAALGD